MLVLSAHLEAAYALELLRDGSDGLGYLLKDRVTEGDAFVDAVRRVAGGGSALDPQVVQELLGRRRSDDPLEKLTPRERDVLALMAEGLTNAGIAARLVVTEKAVERHVTAIFSKLLLDATPADHRRVLAVLKFLERLVERDPGEDPGALARRAETCSVPSSTARRSDSPRRPVPPSRLAPPQPSSETSTTARRRSASTSTSRGCASA